MRLVFQALQEHQNPGLRALFAKAGIKEGWDTIQLLLLLSGSRPALNPPIRMAHANLVLDLFAA